MQPVEVRDEARDGKEEEEEVRTEEVGREEGHLYGLDDEFAHRLSQGAGTEPPTVPCGGRRHWERGVSCIEDHQLQSTRANDQNRARTSASPPRSVSLVVFELSTEEGRDEELE